VLLAPELLTGPVRSTPRAAAPPPPAGEPPLRSYTIDLADESHARGSAPATSGPQQPEPLANAATAATSPVAASAAAPQPGSPPAEDSTRAAAATSAAAAAAPASAAGPSAAPPAAVGALEGSGAWLVQLGSFASRANADHLARQVRSQGFQVSVSQSSSGRHLYRVRVGPAHDRAAAAGLAERLRALGHSGAIVPK